MRASLLIQGQISYFFIGQGGLVRFSNYAVSSFKAMKAGWNVPRFYESDGFLRNQRTGCWTPPYKTIKIELDGGDIVL
ncbi:hypothetical protein EJN90_08615 [Jeotgalibaca ciconiae]|uniref:Uncharacterized protein n=1 Tax=Jeotgalibaca ciconiae TaxID=2496265 RepID=A0A3Q9BKT6_9LACT|nr:hypothetical protein EJN90_08615 [Jeotgalibaca ciconiae]